MAIKLTIELIRFLNAAKRLYNQGSLTRSQILDFARREFGEISGVLKTRLDKLFQKPATGIKKQETKKGEVVSIKKDEGIKSTQEYKDMVEELRNSEIGNTYTGEELEKAAFDILKSRNKLKSTLSDKVTPKKEGLRSLDDIIKNPRKFENEASFPGETFAATPTEKEMIENALETITNRQRLGTRSQEANIRTAVREFLERRLKDGSLNIPDKKDLDAITGVKQGGVDPIEVFRKAYGEDAVATVARMEEEFPNAFKGSSFKQIGDEFEKLFKLEKGNFGSELPTPKTNYGYDEGLMTDQQLREMLEKDLREKEMLENFDTTDRTKNAYGGLAEILKV